MKPNIKLYSIEVDSDYAAAVKKNIIKWGLEVVDEAPCPGPGVSMTMKGELDLIKDWFENNPFDGFWFEEDWLEHCNEEKLKASIFVQPRDLKAVVKSLKSWEFESVETFDSSFQPGVSFVGKPSDIDEWVGEDNEFGITEDDVTYEIHQTD